MNEEYTLKELKEITSEDELGSIVLKLIAQRTAIANEYIKAPTARQKEIKNKIPQLDEMILYIKDKLGYKTRDK